MKHHVHCVHADKNHRGVCRDSQGEALTHLGPAPKEPRQHHQDCAHVVDEHQGPCVGAMGIPLGNEPVTDKLLVGLPQAGEPHSQYKDLEFQEEQVGQVLEGEVFKGTFMPHARPDGPRVEMTITDETGVSITVAAELPAELRKDYDHDMMAQDVHSHAMRLYDGIKAASRE